jgi:alkylation response protein AidB-like acyl-CoA dehydrogenase
MYSAMLGALGLMISAASAGLPDGTATRSAVFFEAIAAISAASASFREPCTVALYCRRLPNSSGGPASKRSCQLLGLRWRSEPGNFAIVLPLPA